jgi:hypothetical protein
MYLVSWVVNPLNKIADQQILPAPSCLGSEVGRESRGEAPSSQAIVLSIAESHRSVSACGSDRPGVTIGLNGEGR